MVVKIELLANRPNTIPDLVELFETTWTPYYVEGTGDARADLKARLNRDRLPVGLVALDGEEVIGAAAVDLDVGTGLEPSIVGLVVASEHQGKGTASSLVAACEKLAAALGHHRLYTSSSRLGGLLSRRGWTEGDRVTFLDGSLGTIYSRDLGIAE